MNVASRLREGYIEIQTLSFSLGRSTRRTVDDVLSRCAAVSIRLAHAVLVRVPTWRE
jgi:hypothetical protein